MVKTTRAQREALKRLYDRVPQYDLRRLGNIVASFYPRQAIISGDALDAARITYRQFRKQAGPTFGCDGAIMIQWCGMWLGIETDGYTHS